MRRRESALGSMDFLWNAGAGSLCRGSLYSTSEGWTGSDRQPSSRPTVTADGLLRSLLAGRAKVSLS